MNEKIILQMIEPYLKDNSLTYDDFDKVFSFLSLVEQYNVVEILSKYEIKLIDVEESSDDSIDQTLNYDVLYDDRIFQDEELEEEKSFQDDYLIVRKKVSISDDVLIRDVQKGSQQAKQDLIVKHLGLVKEWANYYIKMAGNKLDYEDLVQVGMLGLLTAAEKFDFSFEAKFSTYAVPWIRQKIYREICDEGFTIRIPVHKMDRILKVNRVYPKYAYITDYNERLELLAEELDISALAVEECLVLYSQFLRAASLDLPVGEDEDTPLIDFVPQENDVSVEDKVSNLELRERLLEAISTLTEREQKIIRLRFGIDDGKYRTLEEVGREFGVTRERIRQIEVKAIRKLRFRCTKNGMDEFLD